MADIYKIGGHGHFDGTCQETVPMAIRCFLESESFEEAIRIAVMAGGDTDTKAAITGSIAEACYDIPTNMIQQAHGYLPKEMSQVIHEFYNQLRENIDSGIV